MRSDLFYFLLCVSPLVIFSVAWRSNNRAARGASSSEAQGKASSGHHDETTEPIISNIYEACTCGAPSSGRTVIVDSVLPHGSRLLPFARGSLAGDRYFARLAEFWILNQGFQNLQIQDWWDQKGTNDVQSPATRTMSFTKDIPDGLGLKKTKIEISEKRTPVEGYADGISVQSIIRAPDLNNDGDAFEVKTCACTFETDTGMRSLVTVAIEWTSESELKAEIEKAVLDGLKQYHQDLAAFMWDEYYYCIEFTGAYSSSREDRAAQGHLSRPDRGPERSASGIELESLLDDLRNTLHGLSQDMRRIEKRVIDGEERVANLEADNRELRRALKDK